MVGANAVSGGFDGIRYWARQDLEHVETCRAPFAGIDDSTGTERTPTDFAVLITENLLARPKLWEALEHKSMSLMAEIFCAA